MINPNGEELARILIAPERGSDGILNPLFLFQALCCGYSLESSPRDHFNEYPLHRVQRTIIDIINFEIKMTPSIWSSEFV